ncbi:MAG TPA: hypothetical protein VKW06_08200 [Candidatus Angelobacter sp.]|nr:hypothetical protein [Candidatus Angelobacter sp.]
MLAALGLVCPFTWAQEPEPIIVPESHPTSIGGGINDYKDTPPDLLLVPEEAGGRSGRLWIRNIGHALLIVGQVDGGTPDFPRNKSQILSKDHVEVWLAAAPDIPMSPMGWGNQFGEQLLEKGPDSCADWEKEQDVDARVKAENVLACRKWANEQQQYRSVFRKLFARQWLLTESYSIEAYATPAYELITSKFASDQPAYKAEIPEALKPRGKVQMWYTPSNGGRGYVFQIAIPYGSFPPLNTADLENLWLMVDVFNAAPQGKKMGAYSSSSTRRVFGKPETFNHLQLQPKRTFRIAPCSVGLEGRDKYGDRHPGWFVPQHDQFVLGSEYESETFILVNEANGYAYSPSGLSPIVRPTHHFWQFVKDDEWVCGPNLVYQKGQQAKPYEKVVGQPGFGAKRLNDGTLLVKSGPEVYWSEFGSGQCGACPRYGLALYSIDQNLNLADALTLGGVVQGVDDAVDITVNADWSQVVQYQEHPAEKEQADSTWSATTYCLNGMKYSKCKEEKNARPPDPPVLKELRDSDNI